MKNIILLISIGLFYSYGHAQADNKKLENFEFIIQTYGDKIILESKKGSAWQKLTFTTKSLPQAIDEYGMTVLENDKNNRTKSESTLANYTFTILQENGKVILKGIEGTSWKKLTYNCKERNCASRINEMGML